jgi:serine/threonine-protein phosphatase PGAM5
MVTRHLYLARHGAADAFGELTDAGYLQARLLGERLSSAPIDVVWHSPLPRAAATAQELASHLPDVQVIEASELTDHVPYVPRPDETPPSWAGFFDGYTEAEAASGQQIARTLVDALRRGLRRTTISTSIRYPRDPHHPLVPHRVAAPGCAGCPTRRWLGLDSANAALTLIEHRTGLPPAVVMFNEMSHLPADLRWTGFPGSARP